MALIITETPPDTIYRIVGNRDEGIDNIDVLQIANCGEKWGVQICILVPEKTDLSYTYQYASL